MTMTFQTPAQHHTIRRGEKNDKRREEVRKTRNESEKDLIRCLDKEEGRVDGDDVDEYENENRHSQTQLGKSNKEMRSRGKEKKNKEEVEGEAAGGGGGG